MATQTIPKIQVERRDKLGSRTATKLRAGGKLPMVIYGHKQDPVHVAGNAREITDLLRRHSRLLEIAVGDAVEPCLVREVQWDHLGSNIIHLDLTRVDLNEKVTVPVELVFVGEPKVLDDIEGSILDRPVSQIEVECLVTAIPENIRVDVTALTQEEPLTAGQIKLPEGVTLATDPETIVAQIQIVQEEAAPEVVATEGAAEPEVIGRKPTEEEAEEGAAAPKGAAPKAEKPKKE